MVQFAQAKYIYCHQTLPRPTTFPPPCLKNNNSKKKTATPMKSTSPTLPYTNCIELIFRPNKWPADSAGVACPSAFSTAPGRVPMEWLWNEGCKNMLESWVRNHHRTYPTQTSQTFPLQIFLEPHQNVMTINSWGPTIQGVLWFSLPRPDTFIATKPFPGPQHSHHPVSKTTTPKKKQHQLPQCNLLLQLYAT